MHPRVEVREAEERDLDEILRVSLAAHREYAEVLEPAAWEKLEAGVSNVAALAESGRAIVAEAEGAIAGSVVYFPPGSSSLGIFEPGWAFIRMLSVDPERRGRGLGRLLSEECLARAREDGAERVALHTGEQMAAARRLYEGMGFEVLKEIEPRFGFRYWIYTRRP